MSAALIVMGFLGLGFIGGISIRYYYNNYTTVVNPSDYRPLHDEEDQIEPLLKNEKTEHAPKDNQEYEVRFIPPSRQPETNSQQTGELEPLSDSD